MEISLPFPATTLSMCAVLNLGLRSAWHHSPPHTHTPRAYPNWHLFVATTPMQIIASIMMLMGAMMWAIVIAIVCGIVSTFRPDTEPSSPHPPCRIPCSFMAWWDLLLEALLGHAAVNLCCRGNNHPPTILLGCVQVAFRNNMQRLNAFIRTYDVGPDLRQRLREYFYQTKHYQVSALRSAGRPVRTLRGVIGHAMPSYS